MTNLTISVITEYPQVWDPYLKSKFESVGFVLNNRYDIDDFEYSANPYNYYISEHPVNIDRT